MNMNFALRNDPRQQVKLAQERYAYESSNLFKLAVLFKAASLISAEMNPVALAKNVAERLTIEIGLPIATAAQVLQVTRPTIYSWLKQKRAPQAAQLERLSQVNKVSQVISSYLRNKPELDLKAMLPDGSTVLSLLCSDNIDAIRIESALRTLSEMAVRHLADIPDEELEEEGKVNQALLAYLRKAPM